MLAANITTYAFRRGVSISWHVGDFRYHFWVDDTNMTPMQDRIYKNPIKRTPGWNTMKLRASAKKNARMLQEVITYVVENDLVAKAKLKLALEEAERAAEFKRGQRRLKLEELARTHFEDVLKRVREAGMGHLIADIDAKIAALD